MSVEGSNNSLSLLFTTKVHHLQEFGSVVNSGEVAAIGWSTRSFHVSLDLLRFLIFFP